MNRTSTLPLPPDESVYYLATTKTSSQLGFVALSEIPVGLLTLAEVCKNVRSQIVNVHFFVFERYETFECGLRHDAFP